MKVGTIFADVSAEGTISVPKEQDRILIRVITNISTVTECIIQYTREACSADFH